MASNRIDFEPLEEQKIDFQPLEAGEAGPSPEHPVPTNTGRTFGPSKVEWEITPSSQGGKSYWDRPLTTSEPIRDVEIAEIAEKYGADKQLLRDALPYLGGLPENMTFMDAIRRGAGFVNAAVGLDIPTKLLKVAQTPENEKALDDLQDLARQRKSWIATGAEMLSPAGLLSAGEKTLAKSVTKGAVAGAAAGVAGSGRGEELEGGLTGAALGGILGGILQGMPTARVERKLVADTAEEATPGIEKGAQDILTSRATSEQEISRAITGTSQVSDLDQDTVSRILREQITPEGLERKVSPDNTEGAILRETVEAERPELVRDLGIERAVERHLAEEIVETRARDFAEHLTGDRPRSLSEAQEAIAEYASRQGGEATAEKYSQLVREKAAKEYIDQQAIRLGRETGGFVSKTLNDISDAQFVLRAAGKRSGLDIEKAHQELNTAYNRMTYPRQQAAKELDQIFRGNRDVDDVITGTDKIYQALDSGDFSGLTDKEARAARQFADYFEKQRQFVNEVVQERDPSIAPLSIPRLVSEGPEGTYVPHYLKSSDQLVTAVADKMEEAKSQVGRPISDLAELSRSEFEQLRATSGPVSDLIAAVELIDSKKVSSGADLSARLKDTFYSREGRSRLTTLAKSALERSGEIPPWMRETNLYKLADSWTTGTLKHLYLRKPIDQLASYSRILEKSGADLEAKYLRDLLADIQGLRQGTASEATLQGKVYWQRGVDKLAKSNAPGAKAAAIVAKALPEILSDLQSQIYPNLLGLSPRAIIMNMTQTWVKTAPELGSKYGYYTVLRASMLTSAALKQQAAKVAEWGLAPAEFTTKYRQAVAEGIRRNSLYAIPADTLRALSDWTMKLYTKMDTLNRSVVVSVAEIMARDLATGSKLAQETLQRLPRDIRARISKAISAGDQEGAARIIATHLNATTQYNYNRLSMSQFGRSMGPLFSTFSKWPTATAGEIIAEYRDKGALRGTLRNLDKFVLPYLLLRTADYFLEAGTEDSGDRTKMILGRGGLASSAPIGSAAAIVTGDFFTPPAVDALMQTVVLPALRSKDAEDAKSKLGKGLGVVVQNFTPGSGVVRFLTDDLLTIISGERPEGSNFIERTKEGARRLEKGL